MTARALETGNPSAIDGGRFGAWLESGALLVGLAAIVGLRWVAASSGMPGVTVGLSFGVALAALWFASVRGSSLRSWAGPPVARAHAALSPGAIAAGATFGLILVLVTIAGSSMAGAALPVGMSRPAGPFLPWALVTVLVAATEEGILRGAVFDRLRVAGGLPVAIAVTTAAFALMHVPLYGWHVVPLDLAVGLGLAGLRITTGSIVAPAAAHAVADLATWWL
jgi:membrane protease YdiL (CAAX protease family)